VNQSRLPLHQSKSDEHRSAARRPLALPGRLTWRDSRGATRFATVVTRNVSDHGVFVECSSASMIPLYRLVYLQFERDVHALQDLPPALRQGKILSAIYRIDGCGPRTGTSHGYALRLLVEPEHKAPAARPTSAVIRCLDQREAGPARSIA
jgi:hypothetical protein